MKHRWEIGREGKDICIKCGYVRYKIEQFVHASRRVYERGTQKSPKAPPCDATWPDDWKPRRRYSMFLDDIRQPPIKKRVVWIVVRSFDEAVAYIVRHGIPGYISFDHDLGDDVPTGHDLAKWLVNLHLDEIELFPDNFRYSVHSANPPGAANITGLLDNFLTFLSVQKNNR